MSEPIKVGDLVQVVRGHECDLGNTGIALEIETWDFWSCPKCHAFKRGPFLGVTMRLPVSGAPLSWLKRIPPLGELGDVKRDEEITA